MWVRRVLPRVNFENCARADDGCNWRNHTQAELLGGSGVATALLAVRLHFPELDGLAAVGAAGGVGVGEQRRAKAALRLAGSVERAQGVRACPPLPENEVVRHLRLRSGVERAAALATTRRRETEFE